MGGQSNRKEKWKPVVGFEDLYEVSNLGRIKSKAHSITRSNGWVQTFRERIRRISTNVNGYKAVTLNFQGGYYRKLVSHMVMEAFVGPRPKGKEVSHEDGDLENNTRKNLKYRTKLSNVALQKKHGTYLFGERCHMAKLKNKQIPNIRKRIASGESDAAIAATYKVSPAAINRIASGRTWKNC